MNSFQRFTRDAGRSSIILKVVLISVLMLVLLIPLSMIQSIVHEREMRRSEAENSILADWGGGGTVAGPFLTVPYIEYSLDVKGKRVETVRYARFLPETLSFDAEASPEKRSRGIYDTTVYTAKIRVQGVFRRPGFGGWRISASDILWNAAFVSVELPDMRAVQERVLLSWGSRSTQFDTAAGSVGIFQGELRAPVPGLDSLDFTTPVPFSFDLTLRGGGTLSFMPLGGETTARIRSSWPSPSFNGSFLPISRNIESDGFKASWRVLSLARAFPQRWLPEEVKSETIQQAAFGVFLMNPVDSYMKVTRALKYGILFLLLPFLTLFFFEVFAGKRIHPLQYLFVGFAECIFYLLLLSLCEHVPFWVSYLLAAAASAGLITVYTCAVVGEWKKGILILPVLAAAYGFLFMVLRSEDYALLVGSLGLFLILGAVMMMTRKIDWYGMGRPRPAAGDTVVDKTPER